MIDLTREGLTVAVFGAGTMGRGIAQVCAQAGLTTLLADARDGAVAEAIGQIDKALGNQVAKGRMSEADMRDTLARLKPIASPAEAASAGIVIEAIIETLEAKRVREFTDVARPVDDAIAFRVRRNAEPRPIDADDAGA